MTDLGTPDGDPCSSALSINATGLIVGAGSNCESALHAALWDNGGPAVDLNTLIPSNPGVLLYEALYINDRGDIAALGTLSNGDIHSFVLTPCDENHAGIAGCDYSLMDANAAAQSKVRRDIPSSTQRPPQWRWSNRFHTPGMLRAGG
jgi:probable HAF family extracellular repeat protein